MGGACSKRPRVAPANAKGEGGNKQGGKGSVKGGSVAGGSAAGHNKVNAAASTAGGGYQNQVLAKIKQDTANMGVTGVNASLGLDYIRMENKLLEQNISRVLSMVGKDGRTVCVPTTRCSHADAASVGDNDDSAEAVPARGGLLEDARREYDDRLGLFNGERRTVQAGGAAAGAAAAAAPPCSACSPCSCSTCGPTGSCWRRPCRR